MPCERTKKCVKKTVKYLISLHRRGAIAPLLLPVKGLEGAKFGCVRRFFTLSREDRLAVLLAILPRGPG